MGIELFSFGGLQFTLGHALAAVGLSFFAFVLGLVLRRHPKPLPGAGALANNPSERSPSDAAFMKGLTHMMADNTDQAIEEFTRAVTLNSDTLETYVVLGNLFRQKGEIGRAVRIRQSIIARPNLQRQVHIQALYDLGQDYRKGGLYNRAVEAFQEVLKREPGHVDAQRELASMREETKDWEKAFGALKHLDKLTGKDSRPVLAHYKTELGKELMAAGHLEKAESALAQAIKVDANCLDAYLHLGDLELAMGRSRKALNLWRKAVQIAPVHAHLVVSRVAAAEETLGERVVSGFFEEIDTRMAEVNTLLAIADYYHSHRQYGDALPLLDSALDKDPSLLDAHRLRGRLLLDRGDDQEALDAYHQLLERLSGDWATYRCSQCGFVSQQLTWKCPRCQYWDTITLRTN